MHVSRPGARRPYAPRHVLEAARRIRRKMLAANDGRLPRCLTGWRFLCLRFGVQPVAMFRCPPAFTARLLLDQAADRWLIAYNPRRPAGQQMRMLSHELAEYIAIGDFPALFDGLPGSPQYRYDGGDDPRDVRHRIAQCFEHMTLPCAGNDVTVTPEEGQNPEEAFAEVIREMEALPEPMRSEAIDLLHEQIDLMRNQNAVAVVRDQVQLLRDQVQANASVLHEQMKLLNHLHGVPPTDQSEHIEG